MANKRLNALITIGGAVAGSLKTAIGSTTSQLGKIGAEVNKLKRNQAELSHAIQTFGGMGKNVDNLRAKYATVTAEINRLTKAQERLNQVESARLKNREKFEQAKGQIGGAIATTITLGAPIKMAADFETAMLGVAKQLDGARDSSGKLTQDFFDMRQEILQLGRTLPVTNNELATMTGAGLKMGISKKDIVGYTKEVVKMGTAFELPYDQLAEDMGKIANMYKRPIKNISELADTINYLDDNALSAGGDIIDFMQRVGGTASMVKITDKNVAAMGSTLLSLGEKSETASTAINAVFSKFGAANTQSKPFIKMVEEIGMTTNQLEKGMQTDAVGTIFKVMDQINQLPKIAKEGGTSQIDAVATLLGAEHWDTFSKLMNNRNELEKQLRLANSSDAQGSMDKEFSARMETTQAQWQTFKNKITEGGINIGSVLLPVVNDIMDKVGSVVTVFTDWANANPKLTNTVVKVAAALMAFKVGFLAVRLVMFAMKSPILGLVGGFTRLSTSGLTLGKVFIMLKAPFLIFGGAVSKLKGVLGGSAQAIARFATSGSMIRTTFSVIGTVIKQIGLALLRTPWGAVAAIAIGAGMAIYKYWDYIKAFFQGFWQGLKVGIEPFTSAVSGLIQSTPLLGAAWDIVSKAVSTVFNWFKDLLKPVNASKEDIEKATSAGKAFGEIVGSAINLVLTPLNAVIKGFSWIIDNASKVGGVWGSVKSWWKGDNEPSAPQVGVTALNQPASKSLPPTVARPTQVPPIIARAPSQRMAPQQNFTNSFTIHAAPGQDPKQIAQEAVKLMRQETAVAQRSSNLDWGYSQ